MEGADQPGKRRDGWKTTGGSDSRFRTSLTAGDGPQSEWFRRDGLLLAKRRVLPHEFFLSFWHIVGCRIKTGRAEAGTQAAQSTRGVGSTYIWVAPANSASSCFR